MPDFSFSEELPIKLEFGNLYVLLCILDSKLRFFDTNIGLLSADQLAKRKYLRQKRNQLSEEMDHMSKAG